MVLISLIQQNTYRVPTMCQNECNFSKNFPFRGTHFLSIVFLPENTVKPNKEATLHMERKGITHTPGKLMQTNTD